MSTAEKTVEFIAAMNLLKFTPEQQAQQADVALRLLQMACLGAPRPSPDSPVTPNLMAAMALMVSYTALAEADPALTGLLASLAFDMSHRLAATHEARLQADINVAMSAAETAVPSTTH